MTPRGVMVSLADPNGFQQPTPGHIVAGMLIGSVYRLKVTNIPGNEGLEVYPTIEVIDRLYPPIGQAPRFPIPIDITQEELELALSGKFVMRVVYLEDPNDALPIAEKCGDQSVFQALPGENPLTVADRLGRPMLILRMGARLPDADGPDAAFLYGSPPWINLCGQPAKHPTQTPPLKPPVRVAGGQAAAADATSSPPLGKKSPGSGPAEPTPLGTPLRRPAPAVSVTASQ